MKPPLTYFGGKQRLASTIIPLIPKHQLYCEPFFGGGAVFFAKDPSEIEVINDTNGELVNFYKVVKNDFNDLQREIKTTLHSRQLHENARIVLQHPELFNEVKRAWAVWVLANQSYGGRMDAPWGYDRKQNTSGKRIARKRDAFTEVYAARLKQAQIESADALRVIASRDSPDSFFYCDPPYFNGRPGHYKAYSERDFEALLQVLAGVEGKFLLSSYPSDTLARYSKNQKWYSKAMEAPLAITSRYLNRARRKVEVLTANYQLESTV